MVGTEKLLAAGHVAGCCPAFISGRRSVLSPLTRKILEVIDVSKEEREKRRYDERKEDRSRIFDEAYTTVLKIKQSHLRRTTRITVPTSRREADTAYVKNTC